MWIRVTQKSRKAQKYGPEKHFMGVNERTHSQLGNHASNSSCAYIREWLKVYT